MKKKPNPASFRKALLAWYGENKRDLPWRRTKDPYKILVSEIMLQQTQVDTVIPYYRRWMKRFPTVQKLAGASLDEVLSLWEGMGYYSRARNLHRAARAIVEIHGGKVPDSLDALLSLPGFGKYTAGAVASIAFQQSVPAVDANVRRVFARLHAHNATEKEFEDWGILLMGESSPSDFNQALMELGALICVSKSPRCGRCPVAADCAAFNEGRQEEFPAGKKRTEIREIRAVLGIIIKKGKVYIQKRPPEGLFAGLWEFPGGKVGAKESPEKALSRELREELGAKVEIAAREESVRHAYTRFRVVLSPFLCVMKGKGLASPEGREHRWVKPEELQKFAFPAANRKIIQRLLEDERFQELVRSS